LRECLEFAAEETPRTVQDGVERSGACVYSQNILSNQ